MNMLSFFRVVPTSAVGVVQTFGRHTRTVGPGLRLHLPVVQTISVISTRLSQKIIRFSVKTRDNVFVSLEVAVQYRVDPADVSRAFFSLDRPLHQMTALIENVVRASAPRLSLDELFAAQDDIAHAVAEHVAPRMRVHGYTIENTLVTEITPSERVREAMNEINATERLKQAAQHRADAAYIEEVRRAEAERDRRRLLGEGISLQRQAILSGYRRGMVEFGRRFGLSAAEVLRFVTDMQRLDTLASIGKAPNSKTVFLDHGATTQAASLPFQVAQAGAVPAVPASSAAAAATIAVSETPKVTV